MALWSLKQSPTANCIETVVGVCVYYSTIYFSVEIQEIYGLGSAYPDLMLQCIILAFVLGWLEDTNCLPAYF